MIEKKIEELAYQLKQNREDNEPGAIVFIGAGCSISAGIPATSVIVDYVLKQHKDKPQVKCLGGTPSYADLMACLTPKERKKIFKHYVEKAKTNVSHIYLAHLMKLGFVDYIVTVNFDDLAQRALALHGIFPPIYDISILKDFTTTTLETKSIIYLHGQYNGLWQLNTKEEMNKVLESGTAERIFHQITNRRPWIIIGYSGEDRIFDELVKLGRFDDGLYWVGYKDYEPLQKVRDSLLNKPNTESFYIKGFDADSFFLKLNAELKQEQPPFFSHPFSFLLETLKGIVDIEDSEDYKSVKERFEASKTMVEDAIDIYENAKSKKPQMTKEAIEKNQLRAKLIDSLINEKYNEIERLEKQVKDGGYDDLLPIVADLYWDWGTYLGDVAKTEVGTKAEELYKQAFEKYQKAINIKPDFHEVYYNWGVDLENLATTKTGTEAEKLHKLALEKYRKTIEIEPNKDEPYYNWGTGLLRLASTKKGAEAEELYKQAFEKFKKAVEIKPDKAESYYNWGNGLRDLAKTKIGIEAEELYKQAFEKFAKAVEIEPDKHEAYNNWGFNLIILAKTKTGMEAEKLYKQAFEKFSKAIEIKSDKYGAYYNWGVGLISLARNKTGAERKEILSQAIEKMSKAIEFGGSAYYLSCANALMNNIEEAFYWLEIALEKKDISFEYIEKDSDWDKLRNLPKYKELKKRFLKNV